MEDKYKGWWNAKTFRKYKCATSAVEYKALGWWVANQRQYYADKKLKGDRKKKLDNLGFNRTLKAAWKDRSNL